MKIITETKYIVPNNEEGKEYIEDLKPEHEEHGCWSKVIEADTSLILSITEVADA